MRVKPKAIFVGPDKIGDFLATRRTDWEFTAIVPDIATLLKGLNDQSIDNDVQIILTVDGFFKADSPSDVAFEQLIAMMYPYCLFLIISYSPQLQGQIRNRVETQTYAMSNSSTEEYYFVNPKAANVSIDEAVAKYVRTTSNEEIAAILSGRDVQDIQEDFQQEVEPVKMSNYNFDEIESDRIGQVIAVTSSKGGSGKSTVATTLATYLAHSSINSVKEGKEERPLKVVILDLDVRDGQIGFLTGNLQPTILTMRSGGISEETLNKTLIHSSRLKVDLLLAPKRPRISDDTPPEFYLELIQFLRKFYDYIILDTSVNYIDPLLEKVAYPIADKIVFVTDIVITSVYSMARWIQEVTRPKTQDGMGIDQNKIGIVVNKTMSNIDMDHEIIAKSALGVPVLTAIPNSAKIISHATNLQSMEAVLRHQDIRGAIRVLAKRIVGRQYNLSNTVT